MVHLSLTHLDFWYLVCLPKIKHLRCLKHYRYTASGSFVKGELTSRYQGCPRVMHQIDGGIHEDIHIAKELANSNSIPSQQTKRASHFVRRIEEPIIQLQYFSLQECDIYKFGFKFMSFFHPNLPIFMTLKSMTHCIAVVALSLEFQATTFARPWRLHAEQGSSWPIGSMYGLFTYITWEMAAFIRKCRYLNVHYMEHQAYMTPTQPSCTIKHVGNLS